MIRWTSLAILPLTSALLAWPARSEEEASARVLDTEAWVFESQTLVVRAAVEISGPPHRWYGVYVQFRLEDGTPIQDREGKDFLLSWGDLFTPEEPRTLRWSQCRVSLPLADLAASKNLPRGRSFAMLAISDVWDKTAAKYIASGSDLATPILLTTDPGGGIRAISFFYTPPFALESHHPSGTIPARKCSLRLDHLQLAAGTSAYRTFGLRHESIDVLHGPANQVELSSQNRGALLGPIDSPEKARELFELAYPKSLVVETPDAYRNLVGALRTIRDWDEKRFVLAAEPQSYGLVVEPVPGHGYRVRALVVYHHDYGGLGYRSVVHYSAAIATDGRMGVAESVAIRGPETPYGAPPGWEPEFGRESANPDPGRPTNEMAAIDAHNDAVARALALGGFKEIPARLVVSEERVRVPCAANADPRWFGEGE